MRRWKGGLGGGRGGAADGVRAREVGRQRRRSLRFPGLQLLRRTCGPRKERVEGRIQHGAPPCSADEATSSSTTGSVSLEGRRRSGVGRDCWCAHCLVWGITSGRADCSSCWAALQGGREGAPDTGSGVESAVSRRPAGVLHLCSHGFSDEPAGATVGASPHGCSGAEAGVAGTGLRAPCERGSRLMMV